MFLLQHSEVVFFQLTKCLYASNTAYAAVPLIHQNCSPMKPIYHFLSLHLLKLLSLFKQT